MVQSSTDAAYLARDLAPYRRVAALFVVAAVDALRSSESETAEPTTTAAIENESSPTASTPASGPSLSAEQEIERAGNKWARLFAGGDRRWAAPGTCTYMTQPGCERISCEHVGGRRPIENCTPPSWQFRKSFTDATVVDIVIRGRRGAARFSNGETVEFFDVGEAWWIHDVGGDAGRNFFE
jgi:hypothetical protein